MKALSKGVKLLRHENDYTPLYSNTEIKRARTFTPTARYLYVLYYVTQGKHIIFICPSHV